MREFLKGLDLDKETIDTIMVEHGKYLTGLKEKNEELETQNKELEKKVKEAESIDVEAIKKEQFDLGKAEGSQEVETFKKSIALKEALKSTKAKDIDLLSKLIADDKISYEEKDGNYVVGGLNEQVEEIKKTHDYLFEKETEPTQRINVGGTHTEQPKSEPTTLIGALKEAYSKK